MLAAFDRVEADDCAGKLRAPGADEARDAKNLARVEGEADIPEKRTTAEPLDPKHLVASLPAGAVAAVTHERAPDHHADQLFARESFTSFEPTRWPSRSTVSRSPMRKISSRWCDI